MLFGEPPVPSIQVGELQSVEINGQISFRLAVTNNGEGYVPIHADLQIADGSGRAIELRDGFGRWLQPGEFRELAFVPEKVLPAGDYQLSLKLQTTAEQAPVTQTMIVRLAREASSAAQP